MKVAGILTVLVAIGAETVSGQTLTGRVLDAENQNAIRNAFVEVLAGDDERVAGAFTDGDGRFRVQVSESDAPSALAIGALGYGTGSWEVPQLGVNATTEFGDLELEAMPITLEPIEITGFLSRLTRGREWIRRRQLVGAGTFFSGAVLAALNPRSLSVHLAEETEFWVTYDWRGTPSVRNPREDCTLVFVDQWPLNVGPEVELQSMGYASLDDVPLEWIAAVEVYDDMRDVPPGRLQLDPLDGSFHNCATINVWTWNSW